MSEIYAFLGPALPKISALGELDAVYLPPAVEGDICRLMQLRPRVIAIIDGGYGNAAQIGHKEIMWAMEHGVHVFGGAGIGALRAVELQAFGMRGAGWVYEAFRDGALEQDDEITVAYERHDQGYRRLSEPMVNIRHALLAAAQEKVITEATCHVLTIRAKARFYAHRDWPGLLSIAEQEAGPAEVMALRDWLAQGRPDLVARDTVTLLRAIREFMAADPPPLMVPWTIANTTHWNAVRRRAVSTAGADLTDGLHSQGTRGDFAVDGDAAKRTGT